MQGALFEQLKEQSSVAPRVTAGKCDAGTNTTQQNDPAMGQTCQRSSGMPKPECGPGQTWLEASGAAYHF